MNSITRGQTAAAGDGGGKFGFVKYLSLLDNFQNFAKANRPVLQLSRRYWSSAGGSVQEEV